MYVAGISHTKTGTYACYNIVMIFPDMRMSDCKVHVQKREMKPI